MITILNIYGDTAQLLKSGRGIDDWKRLAPTVPHIRTHILNENYRNTNQITEYCNDTLHMNMERTGVDGGPVKEIHRNELEAALSNLKLNQERIAVIVPRAVSKGTYLDHPKESAARLGRRSDREKSLLFMPTKSRAWSLIACSRSRIV